MYIHLPCLNLILILHRSTGSLHLTKLRITSLSVLASQWTIYLLPQSDGHRLASVSDVHGVGAKAQTRLPIQGLLVLQVSYLHEYFSIVELSLLAYLFTLSCMSGGSILKLVFLTSVLPGIK